MIIDGSGREGHGVVVESLIVVCTCGRPEEVRELGELLSRIRGRRDVLVVDASSDDETDVVCRSLPFVGYRRSERAGIAFQRNRAVAIARAQGVDVVHFVDDDSRPSPGYFDALDEVFETTGAAGVGGTVVNDVPPRGRWLLRLFLLDHARGGVVLPSGWASDGHLPGGGGTVEWLPGCAMSYRLSAIEGRWFDDRLHGHAWGEDVAFSHALGREGGPLHVCPAARIRHHPSPVNRASYRSGARERIPLHHRWVVENRRYGLRRRAFWWGVTGEVLLRGVAGAVLRGADGRRHRDLARGLLDGVVDVLRGRVPGGPDR